MGVGLSICVVLTALSSWKMWSLDFNGIFFLESSRCDNYYVCFRETRDTSVASYKASKTFKVIMLLVPCSHVWPIMNYKTNTPFVVTTYVDRIVYLLLVIMMRKWLLT
jgi:hypothetical protein